MEFQASVLLMAEPSASFVVSSGVVIGTMLLGVAGVILGSKARAKAPDAELPQGLRRTYRVLIIVGAAALLIVVASTILLVTLLD